MEVSEILQKAWIAVEEASLPEKIHEVAFREAVRFMVSVPSVPSAPARVGNPNGGTITGSPGDRGSSSEARTNVTEEEMYSKVAAQTGVDRGKLEHVVHLDDDGPRVSIAGLKLGRNNAERARSVAQILTITRGFGIGENETPLEVIRTECERLKVHDSTNFAKHMKALNGYVISGTGQNRRLRAKGQGIAAFPALVDSLMSDS